MSTDKKIVLVTGGNSGIGFELCNQLLAIGTYHILLAARSPEKGKAAVADLQSRNLPGTVELLDLDITSDDSISAAAKSVESKHGHLDILVNNAAIAGAQEPLRQCMQNAFDANATGVAMTTYGFIELLRKSSASPPRIINVSTGGASIALLLDPNSFSRTIKHLPYRTSKAALNMVSAWHSVEFEPDGIKVFTYCPGYTESNLSPRNNIESGAQPVAEGVHALTEIVEGKRDDQAGEFLNHQRGTHPW